MRVSRLMIVICLLVFINFQPAVYALPNPYISSFNPSVGWTSSSTDPKSGTLVKILGLDFDPIL